VQTSLQSFLQRPIIGSLPEPLMTDLQRFLHRLRRRALQFYELLLYGALVAMAAAVALSASGGEPDDATQCGKAQSSAEVMTT
jgi:hypothetical protein